MLTVSREDRADYSLSAGDYISKTRPCQELSQKVHKHPKKYSFAKL
jgi:hypothetical protein